MAKNFGWASGGSSILSEFGTLHMEFAYLSDITGDPRYVKAVEKVRETIVNAERPKTLYPNYLNPKTGKWGQQHTSVGALGDSFYEYLLKEWLRSGNRDTEAKRLFDEAALDIEKQLVKKSPGGLTYIAEYKYGRTEDKMDHLACFAGKRTRIVFVKLQRHFIISNIPKILITFLFRWYVWIGCRSRK